MPKARLDPATKVAILKAALDARKAGQAWSLAHEAAKQSGYKGTVNALVQLVRNSKRLGRKGGRKAGRPKASTAAATPLPSNGGNIASLVENLISARVNAAIERAVAVL